jgi:murein L,D-transpeptidase YcbB/YkuD
LRSLQPDHDQFERLRKALLAARAKAAATGKDPNADRAVQHIVINMERWRWMPRSLGATHVWNNVPEFNTRVVKNGKTIFVGKTIVGELKYPTPVFSATMRSIVFHPDWTVPSTILKEDLAPSLQQGGFFGGASTAILRQHNLRVSLKGKPVDADTVDWPNVDIRKYTFTQPPGPDNVLGKLKFNFPNRHAIYMHDTVQPELFNERVRTLSHGCIRVHEPERLAATLLAEDKGWPAAQVKSLLARGASNAVSLNHSIPVHLTYFTLTADENGEISTFGDIYGLDGRLAPRLFDKPANFGGPVAAPVVASEAPQRRRKNNDPISGVISGLFGN